MQLVFGLGVGVKTVKICKKHSKHLGLWRKLEVNYVKLWLDPPEPPGAVVGHEGSSAVAADAPLEEHTAMMASPPQLTKCLIQRYTKIGAVKYDQINSNHIGAGVTQVSHGV